jgi:hypothetical protein
MRAHRGTAMAQRQGERPAGALVDILNGKRLFQFGYQHLGTWSTGLQTRSAVGHKGFVWMDVGFDQAWQDQFPEDIQRCMRRGRKVRGYLTDASLLNGYILLPSRNHPAAQE